MSRNIFSYSCIRFTNTWSSYVRFSNAVVDIPKKVLKPHLNMYSISSKLTSSSIRFFIKSGRVSYFLFFIFLATGLECNQNLHFRKSRTCHEFSIMNAVNTKSISFSCSILKKKNSCGTNFAKCGCSCTERSIQRLIRPIHQNIEEFFVRFEARANLAYHD